MNYLELTGLEVLAYTLALAIATIAVILGLRYYLSHNTLKNSSSNSIRSRVKNEGADEVKLSGILFRYGLMVSIAFSFFAFSWSVDEFKVYELNDGPMFEELEVTPPITNHAKPLPPPPPPPRPKLSPIIDLVETTAPKLIDEVITPPKEVTKTIYNGPYNKEAKLIPPPPPLPEIKEEKRIFKIVEQMPRFPGCEDMAATNKEKEVCATKALLEFFYSNVRYPAYAKENQIQGTAVIRFTVDKTGDITDIKILSDPGGGIGAEATRVTESMNHMPQKWTPGKQRKNNVAVMYTLPIQFKLR